MLKIREEQFRALAMVSAEAYVDELAVHCREYAPGLCGTLEEVELRAAIRHGIARAAGYGFSQRGPVRLYVDLMIVFGSGFDTDPQIPWAARILVRDDEAQMKRAEALHEWTGGYLERVDGKHNVHTLNALSDLRALVDRGVPLRDESFQQDVLGLMEQIHPRKVAETGGPALRRLLTDAVAKAESHGFRGVVSRGLLAVLMFAFGHQCDADPFHPWIARSLARTEQGKPDAAAQRLQRRALVWLDAVLNNAQGRA